MDTHKYHISPLIIRIGVISVTKLARNGRERERVIIVGMQFWVGFGGSRNTVYSCLTSHFICSLAIVVGESEGSDVQ